MPKIHFWNKLLEISYVTQTSQKTMYQYSQFPTHISTRCRLWSAVILARNKMFSSGLLCLCSLTSPFHLIPNLPKQLLLQLPKRMMMMMVTSVKLSKNQFLLPEFHIISTNNDNNNVIKQPSVKVPSKSFPLYSNTLLYQNTVLVQPVLLKTRNI